MAFPVREGTVVVSETTPADTDHVVDLPAGIQVGELLWILVTVDSNPTITPPTGWWSRGGGGTGFQGRLFGRIADGTEGTTATFTTDSSVISVHLAGRMSGQVAGMTDWPDRAQSGNNNSTTHDPPLLTPAPGAKDYLWFAIAWWDGSETVSSFSTNYEDYSGAAGGEDTTSLASPLNCGICFRNLNAASEDPGVITLSASENGRAMTIAVEPAAAGAAVSNDRLADMAFSRGRIPGLRFGKLPTPDGGFS